jgi:hypothetical protein
VINTEESLQLHIVGAGDLIGAVATPDLVRLRIYAGKDCLCSLPDNQSLSNVQTIAPEVVETLDLLDVCVVAPGQQPERIPPSDTVVNRP